MMQPPPPPPPPGAPPGPPPPYGSAYGAPPVLQTSNGMAIASFVCSLVGVLFCLTAPLGIVFGHVAVSQIKRANGTQGGRGMAVGGLIVGYLAVAAWIALVVAVSSSDTSAFS